MSTLLDESLQMCISKKERNMLFKFIEKNERSSIQKDRKIEFDILHDYYKKKLKKLKIKLIKNIK